MIDLPDVDFKARPTHSVLGPALWLFGTTLWAYVVVGQLVVVQDFPEPIGVIGALFTIAASWYFAIEQSFLTDEPTPKTRLPRILAPLGIALGLWLATTLLSAAIGHASSDNIDSVITLALWLFSLIALFVGRRMISGTLRAPQDSARRALGILLWLGAALVTLVALFPIVA